MRRTLARTARLVAAAAVLAAAGCTSNSNPVATTTTTGLQNEYTGVLTSNGGLSFPFAVSTSGQVIAQLVSLSPDIGTLVGFGLGVWDGSACQTAPGVWQDKASSGSTIVGQASAAGSLCVRIYDSQGTLPNPETFDLTVTHP